MIGLTAVETHMLREQASFQRLMSKHMMDCAEKCQSTELKSLCQNLSREHMDFFNALTSYIQNPRLS